MVAGSGPTPITGRKPRRTERVPQLPDLASPDTMSLMGRLAPGVDLLGVEANFAVVRLYGALAAAMDAYLAPHGLSPARLTILRILFEAPDNRLSMGQLRRGLNVTSTNVSKLVTALERKTLVRRVAGQHDRRVVLAELTDAGREQFLQIMPCALRHIESFWARLDEQDKVSVIQLLGRVWMSIQETTGSQQLRRSRKPGSASN